jgi:hypothetical protein
MSKPKLRWNASQNFWLLLICLILTTVVVPVVEGPKVSAVLNLIGFSTIYLTGLLANRRRPAVFYSALSLAVVGLVSGWGNLFFEATPVFVTRHAVAEIFFAMTAAMILIAIFKDYTGSMNAVVGAICVYLLLGLAWADLYSAIDELEGGAFVFSTEQAIAISPSGAHRTSVTEWLYLSFVTMSTLGYGDVIPKTPLSQTAAWTQAVVGQLYLAALVARLISLLPTPTRGGDANGEREP